MDTADTPLAAKAAASRPNRMNDEQLAGIEALEARGFVFVLKWDGARTSRKRTIVVSNPGLGLSFRRDGDDHSQLIDEALSWADTTIDEGDS